MAKIGKIPHVHTQLQENVVVTPEIVSNVLNEDKDITHVAVIHSETTTGIVNPVEDIGKVVDGKTFIVDAMSSYGGIELDVEKSNIDFLISSSNKCIESVPGFSYVIAKKASLEKTKGNERSLSLALYPQWVNLEKESQFRFTPPTHSIVAFNTALDRLIQEGGIVARNKKYREYNAIVRERMAKLGMECYLKENQGCIISTFRYPSDDFNFEKFYTLLAEKNVVIYPGKLAKEKVFRLGNIGDISREELDYAMDCIEDVYVNNFKVHPSLPWHG